MIYPVISIRQPWAWAILHAGKDVENRSWPLPRKFMGREVLIHAGKRIDREDVIHLLCLGFKVPEKMETGGIVGMTVFPESRFACSKSDWAALGMHHWRIDTRGTRALPFFPCAGRLNFFEVDYPFAEEYHANTR